MILCAHFYNVFEMYKNKKIITFIIFKLKFYYVIWKVQSSKRKLSLKRKPKFKVKIKEININFSCSSSPSIFNRQ